MPLTMFNKDRPAFAWLNEASVKTLSNSYLVDGQTPQDRIRFIAKTAEDRLGIPGFANKFYDYMSRGWISLASPVWSNYGLTRGLPVSCNNSFVGDSVEEIADKIAEIAVMSKNGAGTSAYLGDLRERGAEINSGGTSYGPVHFAEWFDKTINVISQGNVRRGQCAVWLPIEHGDIEEWLTMRSEGHPIADLSFGITITRQWMREMRAGDEKKQILWLKVIKKKFESGYPYLFFTDNVNEQAPKVYRDKGMTIYSSNLCTEIMLPSTRDESFVCNLSSINYLYYDEWKDTDLVETMIFFLDAVLEEYIEKTASIKHMESANRFARNHRALGLGFLGFATLLQDKLLPYGSAEAFKLSEEISKNVWKNADRATIKLAEMFGEPKHLKGYGRRNTTLLALAPTKSSSTILGGVSQGGQFIDDNYNTKKRQQITVSWKNPILIRELEKLGKNNSTVWYSILTNAGSVAHLDFLSDHLKKVFQTAFEIDMEDVILHHASRQRWIDQGQSMNTKYHPSVPTVKVSRDILLGERLGCKSFYYQLGKNVSKEYAQQKASEGIETNEVVDFDDLSCVACEG